MSRSSLRSRAVPSARRIVIGGAVFLAALGLSTTVPASATGFTPSSTYSADHPSTEQRAGNLDGFVIENLPDGLGTPSDFEYEWGDVSFHSRVWETGPDPEGAFKVDLTVKTLRGEKLTDLEAVKDFLVEYEEKEPGDWQLEPVKVGGYDGLFAGNEVFYFIEPGVAAEVTIDHDRFTDEDVLDTAAGFHPEPTT
ncbi:hypothetical protein EV651_105256 [Kribbella sp. VKM Ac-2571]|uniref:hypothetical protein n=1 Tax=Kribbella sp. VKM Ac-2571 TaxID=2512222 RepID=UPI00105E05E6|nr:hypothetical protein [Kribbella sp. VKM Ac-2571]TDO64032.1 hypothetical protein EV651_105256 [Kribbella sp. VKM Ac-2571]